MARHAKPFAPARRSAAVAVAVVAFSACEASDVMIPVAGAADSVVITMTSASVGEQVEAVTEVSVAVGDSVMLEATALSATGFPLGHASFEWVSATPGVATVSASGVVRGLAPGSSLVTASTDEVGATVTVTVPDPGEEPEAADHP